MPLGASRLTLLARSEVTAVAEVIRQKRSVISPGATFGATVSTTQSKFGGSSADFDATQPQYLYVAGNDDSVDFSGDFTLECWIYLNNTSSNRKIFDLRGINAAHPGGDTTFALGDTLLIDANTTSLRVFVDGSDRATLTSGELSATTWHHIAVQRESGTINAWVDGTRAVNYAGSDDYTSVFAANQAIGCNLETASKANGMFGYIDEVRWSTVARYTNGASITVPTAPFVNDADTYLLLHMDGTDGSRFFEDDNGTSRSAVGVSAIGNAQVDTAESQFGGSSLLVDGTGDYLYMPSADWFDPGSGDWTAECWFKSTATANGGLISKRNSSGASGTDFVSYLWSDGKIKIWVSNGSSYIVTELTTASTYNDGSWHHVAFVRNGSDFDIYVDGTSDASTTISGSVPTSSKNFNIGTDNGTNAEFNGHIDEVRISDTARYTTGFTPSTTAFTNDANTLLLLHMDGTDADTDFRDDNGKGRTPIALSAYNNAQLDTTQSKFGDSSVYIDGVNDAVHIDSAGSVTGTGDFTIEFWVHPTSVAGQRHYYDGRSTGNQAAPLIYAVGTTLNYYVSGSIRITASAAIPTANTWYHIAVSRSSGTTKMFVDGTQVGSSWSDSTSYVSADHAIGVTRFNDGNDAVGYFDELRVSDNARYTTTFTPDTAQFQNDANTKLLAHFDGYDGDTTFVDDNGIY